MQTLKLKPKKIASNAILKFMWFFRIYLIALTLIFAYTNKQSKTTIMAQTIKK